MSVERNGVMLRTTSLCLAIAFCAVFHPAFAQTFDPTSGSTESASTGRVMPGLPLTPPPLEGSYRRSATTLRASPAMTPATQTTVITRSGNFAPIQFNPLTPPPLIQDKQLAFPPVDPATAAAAQREMAASGATSTVVINRATPVNAPLTTTGMPGTGFVAPAPLIPNTVAGSIAPTPPTLTTAAGAAQPPVVIAPPPIPGTAAPVPANAPTPLATPEAVADSTMPSPAPSKKLTGAAPPLTSPDLKPTSALPAPFDSAAGPTELSTESKKILGTIPSHINTVTPPKGTKVAISRTSPKVDSKGDVNAYESPGIQIAISHPSVDTNADLTQAYSAFSSGDNSVAIEDYKRVLAADPLNQDALFGLASIYHRLGQLDKARPLYGVLLKNYPTNRDGLNNFLVLISDESPQEALAELQRLEERNPDFSPIPAQEALLLNKLGFANEARNKMIRAIELAPDNLTYKYNLGVMFDSQGDYASATEIYRNLLAMTNQGAVLPISAEALQKRLNFIAQQQTPVLTE